MYFMESLPFPEIWIRFPLLLKYKRKRNFYTGFLGTYLKARIHILWKKRPQAAENIQGRGELCAESGEYSGYCGSVCAGFADRVCREADTEGGILFSAGCHGGIGDLLYGSFVAPASHQRGGGD